MISRKKFLMGAATFGAATMAYRPAKAADSYVIKLGLDLAANHPSTLHAIAAGKEIANETNGKVTLQVFPSNQLGNDTHMISELRAGVIQMMAVGDNILATLVPSAAIDNIGFAFKDGKTAWAALDGAVGDIVRADIAKVGLHPMHGIWDEGFRQTTSKNRVIKSPADLAGFKIRVPPSPISLDLFKDLGAAPTVLNLSELYTALQTGVVDGQENPLANIETQNFYQVQKYCALTRHMWVGYWLLMNGDFWSSLPAGYQSIVENAFNRQAPQQRLDSDALNSSLQVKLASQGMIFNKPDTEPFRLMLKKNGFYSTWKAKFSPDLWAALEKYTGQLG